MSKIKDLGEAKVEAQDAKSWVCASCDKMIEEDQQGPHCKYCTQYWQDVSSDLYDFGNRKRGSIRRDQMTTLYEIKITVLAETAMNEDLLERAKEKIASFVNDFIPDLSSYAQSEITGHVSVYTKT